MVSSSYVDAVAANNVALQHYGQKVVYGHVRTNSGKRTLIQITFDLMNVHKPLLINSALKHRDDTFSITIMMVSFSESRVILVSHDCHSYLHIILTNGVPPFMTWMKKSMTTMEAGRHEAQEASAGDRRAIADAYQAEQLDISGEAKTAKTLRTPEPPTDAA